MKKSIMLIIIGCLLVACSHTPVKTENLSKEYNSLTCREIQDKIFDAESAQKQINYQKVLSGKSPERESFTFYTHRETQLRKLATEKKCPGFSKEEKILPPYKEENEKSLNKKESVFITMLKATKNTAIDILPPYKPATASDSVWIARLKDTRDITIDITLFILMVTAQAAINCLGH